MSDPLPFGKAFVLFFRQMSPHVPMDELALRAAGIGTWGALVCIFIGLAASSLVTLVAARLFVQAISNNFWLFGLSLFVPVFLLIQGTVTVWTYWLWVRIRSSRA